MSYYRLNDARLYDIFKHLQTDGKERPILYWQMCDVHKMERMVLEMWTMRTEMSEWHAQRRCRLEDVGGWGLSCVCVKWWKKWIKTDIYLNFLQLKWWRRRSFMVMTDETFLTIWIEIWFCIWGNDKLVMRNSEVNMTPFNTLVFGFVQLFPSV